MSEMPVFQAIKTRRVTRAFTDTPVARDDVMRLLESARWAPSAGNRRIHKFVVVEDGQAIELIRAVSPGMLGLPAALIVICSDSAKAEIEGVKMASDTTTWIDVGAAAAGKTALQEMHEHGVICDVSHLADPGFWDVVRLSQGPFIASHSNARAVFDHPRNLADDQLRAITDSGGVVGLNFYADFVDDKDPSLDKLVDHLSHIADTIGIEHVGIGPDFLEDSLRELAKKAFEDTDYDPDILDRWIPECDGTEKLPEFTAKLLTRGLSKEDIEKVLGANFMRVFRETWGG